VTYAINKLMLLLHHTNVYIIYDAKHKRQQNISTQSGFHQHYYNRQTFKCAETLKCSNVSNGNKAKVHYAVYYFTQLITCVTLFKCNLFLNYFTLADCHQITFIIIYKDECARAQMKINCLLAVK
jgi:hypothetical protein